MRYGSLILLSLLIGGCSLFAPARPIGVITPSKLRISALSTHFIFELENADTNSQKGEDVSQLIEKARRGEVKSIAQGLTESNREFYIQVYASANMKFAEKVKEEIEKNLNYPVIIKDIPPLYRVRIGPFYKPEDAKEVLSKVREMGYRDAFIVEEIALGK